MTSATAYYKEREKAKQANFNGGMKPADLEDKYIEVTGIDRVGESKFKDAEGNAKMYGIFNIQYPNGAEMLETKLIASGHLFGILFDYFNQEPEPETPLCGVLCKAFPWPGASMQAWMLLDKADVKSAKAGGLELTF